MATKPSQAEMADWFKEIDADGSGKIDMKELRAVIKAFYDWQNTAADDAKIDADTAALMKAVDASGDEKIDKQEFFKFFGSA